MRFNQKVKGLGHSEVAMKIFSWIQGRQAVAVPGVRNVPSWKEPNFPSHLAQAAGTCVN